MEIKGNFGNALLTRNGSSRIISIPTGAALEIFKNISIIKHDIIKNSLGLFSFMTAGKGDHKIKYGGFKGGNHLLQSFKVGCGWNPKGTIDFDLSEMELTRVEMNQELCPDAFYGECFKTIYGAGNAVRDIKATPEGRAIFNEFIDITYTDLGNSFSELYEEGQNPKIQESYDAGWYTEADDRMADYVDQQAAAPGLNTLIGNLRDVVGMPNLNLPLLGEFSTDKKYFIGNISQTFDVMLENRPQKMKLLEKKLGKSVIRVSGSLFKAYEDEILSRYDHLPQAFRYFLNGKFCDAAGCTPGTPVEGVLMYKGHAVYNEENWDMTDEMLGIKTHRAELTLPTNYIVGLGYPSLKQFNGIGLRVVQHLEAPYQGKIFLDTSFRMGAGIVKPEYIMQAQEVFVPE